MLTLLLVAAVLLGLFMSSVPILGFALVSLAITMYPLFALVAIVAVAAWAVNHFRN